MDSAQKISESLRAAAADCGMDVPTDEKARSIIGLGLKESMLAVFGDISQEQIDKLVVSFRQQFLEKNKTPQPLFDGVREGLAQLKESGAALCVATGKNRIGLNRVLTNESMEDVFFYTRTADEARSKPHPQMLLDILDFMGIEAHQALMIGDTTYDMEMASGAKIDAVGVSYGVHSTQSLNETGAIEVFDRYSDLQAWLEPRAEKLFE